MYPDGFLFEHRQPSGHHERRFPSLFPSPFRCCALGTGAPADAIKPKVAFGTSVAVPLRGGTFSRRGRALKVPIQTHFAWHWVNWLRSGPAGAVPPRQMGLREGSTQETLSNHKMPMSEGRVSSQQPRMAPCPQLQFEWLGDRF